ncbi:hypothetical protein M422DRAFT_266250 [Sphaerobolus stellatus SS14]|uniref:Uncharacterized protein n=1 Tax=Sphaerobolus stellatus (strain SS14) TaxID=990650 RepID=A0A0C9TPM5_SPHS4|nr:hypothetical protein M422DRAFT_266250 [Sphaerobolus stellatus SS14]
MLVPVTDVFYANTYPNKVGCDTERETFSRWDALNEERTLTPFVIFSDNSAKLSTPPKLPASVNSLVLVKNLSVAPLSASASEPKRDHPAEWEIAFAPPLVPFLHLVSKDPHIDKTNLRVRRQDLDCVVMAWILRETGLDNLLNKRVRCEGGIAPALSRSARIPSCVTSSPHAAQATHQNRRVPHIPILQEPGGGVGEDDGAHQDVGVAVDVFL